MEHRPLVMMLESTLLHVREKEELARALVCIMQKSGCAKEFLVNILVDEINKQGNNNNNNNYDNLYGAVTRPYRYKGASQATN